MERKYITSMRQGKESLGTRQGLSRKGLTGEFSLKERNYLDADPDYFDHYPVVPNLTCYEDKLQPSGLLDYRGFELYRSKPRIGFLP